MNGTYSGWSEMATPLLLQKLGEPIQNKSLNGTRSLSAQGYMPLEL